MSEAAKTLTVRVPFTIRKRGGRKLAIAANGSTLTPLRPRIDSTLVKALARAHRWNRLLESSRYGLRRGARCCREDQPVLREPGAAAHLAGTRPC